MNRLDLRSDYWTFEETDTASGGRVERCRMDFSYIREKKLREQFKYYIFKSSRCGDKTPATLRQEVCWFKYYEAWLYERGLTSLEQIGQADVEGFLTYLHICVSKKTNRPLRQITQKHIYDTVRGIYRWYAWQKPAFLAAARLFPEDVYQRINRIPRQRELPEQSAKRLAQALRQTDNPCLRCGGTILAATGISPGDLLGLQTDCLQNANGGVRLRYYHHRKRTYCRIPVGDGCVEAVRELKLETSGLRELAPEETKRCLFLYAGKWDQIVVPDTSLFRYWLQSLMKDEENGMTPTCTQLRYARAQDMLTMMQPMAVQELTGVSVISSAERRCGAWRLS